MAQFSLSATILKRREGGGEESARSGGGISKVRGRSKMETRWKREG